MRNIETDFPGLYFLDQKDIAIVNGKNQKAKDALWKRAKAKADEAKGA